MQIRKKCNCLSEQGTERSRREEKAGSRPDIGTSMQEGEKRVSLAKLLWWFRTEWTNQLQITCCRRYNRFRCKKLSSSSSRELGRMQSLWLVVKSRTGEVSYYVRVGHEILNSCNFGTLGESVFNSWWGADKEEELLKWRKCKDANLPALKPALISYIDAVPNLSKNFNVVIVNKKKYVYVIMYCAMRLKTFLRST